MEWKREERLGSPFEGAKSTEGSPAGTHDEDRTWPSAAVLLASLALLTYLHPQTGAR